jgi:hypothetical protein
VYGIKRRLRHEGSIDELDTRMQNSFAEIRRLHIAGVINNDKYKHIVPQISEDFLNPHIVEQLDGAMGALIKL